MRTIGLIGGMSWESTVPYYRLINQEISSRLGKLHSAELLLYSVDFQPIEELQHAGRWDEAGERLAEVARRLEAGGADLIVICTNTMHRVADQVESVIDIPLLHIADATGEAIRRVGLTKVGLLATRFTMEHDFYRGRLESNYGLEVLVPGEDDRELVHRVIYDELCLGRIEASSRAAFTRIIGELAAGGAEGVILGCTEIGLLVQSGDSSIPVFDTTEIHARAAAIAALSDSEKAKTGTG